jgi:hypothetical protein
VSKIGRSRYGVIPPPEGEAPASATIEHQAKDMCKYIGAHQTLDTGDTRNRQQQKAPRFAGAAYCIVPPAMYCWHRYFRNHPYVLDQHKPLERAGDVSEQPNSLFPASQ